MKIYCGCSGFHYDEWPGTFYTEDLPTDIRGTADFVYARLHGRREWYESEYATDRLRQWLEKIQSVRSRDRLPLSR